jgi:hypothetical protein
MCKFFSFVYDLKKDKFYYFDKTIRAKIFIEEVDYEQDSHSSIANYYDYKGKKEDALDKYEYNPLTLELILDQNNSGVDTYQKALDFVKTLDFKEIVPKLIIKPIINPLLLNNYDLTNALELLKDIDEVRSSVRTSVWMSVWDSVWESVGGSVWNLVRDSMTKSLVDLIGDQMRDSLWTYYSSFLDLDRSEFKYCKKIKNNHKNPFQSYIALWERGLLVSVDRDIYRLHAGKDAKVVFEINKKDL